MILIISIVCPRRSVARSDAGALPVGSVKTVSLIHMLFWQRVVSALLVVLCIDDGDGLEG